MTPLNRRRAIALLALAGLFVSTYLLLYALGFYGELACGAGGGCDLVQASKWSEFLGLPVAGWGVGWYAAVLIVAFVGIQAGPGRAPWVSKALLGLALGGVGFTIYLTALELFVIRAICRWCVGSAVLTLLILVLALPEWRLARASRARDLGAGDRRAHASPDETVTRG